MLIFLQAFLEILRKTSAHPVIYIIPLGDTYLCSSIIWCVSVCVCVSLLYACALLLGYICMAI